MTQIRLSNNSISSFPSLIDRFFDGELMDWNRNNDSSTNSTLPAVNIMEDENEYKIQLAAPGLKKEDFRLNYDNGRLSISSTQKTELKEKGSEKYTQREFNYQSFQRTFSIAEKIVDVDKISAKYESGILQLSLPKREEVKPKPAKHIPIG